MMLYGVEPVQPGIGIVGFTSTDAPALNRSWPAPIEVGSVIVRLNGTPTPSLVEFQVARSRTRPGDNVSVDTWKAGRTQQYWVVLGDDGRGTPILVPPEIFAETIALIHYRQGFRAAAAAGEWLREQAGLRFPVGPEALREAAWHEFSKANGRLSYPDAVVVAWAKDRGAKTLAFDDGILDAT